MTDKERYFIRREEDRILFDRTRDTPDGVEHDHNSWYREDTGNGQWFGGAGYLGGPEHFYKRMQSVEVSREEYNKVMDQCIENATGYKQGERRAKLT